MLSEKAICASELFTISRILPPLTAHGAKRPERACPEPVEGSKGWLIPPVGTGGCGRG
jgi:hypothetical protein